MKAVYQNFIYTHWFFPPKFLFYSPKIVVFRKSSIFFVVKRVESKKFIDASLSELIVKLLNIYFMEDFACISVTRFLKTSLSQLFNVCTDTL